MKTDQDIAEMSSAIGERFCETLSEVETKLELGGFSTIQAREIVIGAHLGAVLAFYAASTDQGRGPLLQIINEMLDDMEVPA